MHLPMIATTKNKYVLLGLDRPVWLAEKLNKNYSLPEAKAFVDELINHALSIYTPYVSGIIFPAETHAQYLSAKKGSAGLILTLHRLIHQSDPYSLPIIAPGWGVEHIRNNYGMAYLNMPISESEKELGNKLQFLMEIYDSCQYENIDLLLELPLINEKSSQSIIERYKQVLKLFRRYCHLLILDYSGSMLDSLSLMNVVDTDWLLNDNFDNYSQAKESLRDSLAAGSAGLVMRSSIWPQGSEYGKDMQKAKKFIDLEGLDRVKEFSRIVEEN